MFAAISARAQVTTETLHIHWPDCKEPLPAIYAVLQGSDAKQLIADKVGKCHWTVSTAPDRFNTEINYFSIRVKGVGRTKCRKPLWYEPDREVAIWVESRQPVVQISVIPLKQVRLTYARELTASSPDVPCTEIGTLPDLASHWTIDDVHLGIETVRMHFPGASDVCGFVLNAVPWVYQAAKRKGTAILVGQPTFIDTLTAQGNGQGKCSAPNLSPAAISILEKRTARQPAPTLSIKAE